MLECAVVCLVAVYESRHNSIIYTLLSSYSLYLRDFASNSAGIIGTAVRKEDFEKR